MASGSLETASTMPARSAGRGAGTRTVEHRVELRRLERRDIHLADELVVRRREARELLLEREVHAVASKREIGAFVPLYRDDGAPGQRARYVRPRAVAVADSPADVRTVVDFLRNKSGMKVKTGILNGKRVDYFKGTPVRTGPADVQAAPPSRPSSRPRTPSSRASPAPRPRRRPRRSCT